MMGAKTCVTEQGRRASGEEEPESIRRGEGQLGSVVLRVRGTRCEPGGPDVRDEESVTAVVWAIGGRAPSYRSVPLRVSLG